MLKRRVRGEFENILKLDGTSLGAVAEGDVTDIVAVILLIMGALLDRFKLTIAQSTSMIVQISYLLLHLCGGSSQGVVVHRSSRNNVDH